MNETRKFELTHFFALMSGYAFISSSFYLTAFWNEFGINIFEYLTVSDVLVRSIVPLIVTSSVFLGLAMGEWTNSNARSKRGPKEEKIRRANAPKFKRRLISFLVALAVATFSVGLTLRLWSEFIYFFLFYGFSASLLLYSFLIKLDLMEKFEEMTGMPGVLLIVVVTIPMAFNLGKSRAVAITSGASYQHAQFLKEDYSSLGEFAYLGEAGGRVFFWSFESEAPMLIGNGSAEPFILVKKVSDK